MTRDLVDRVQHARLGASEARLRAHWVLARLADTGIRVASTRERGGLIREQGRQTLFRARAARDHVRRSRA